MDDSEINHSKLTFLLFGNKSHSNIARKALHYGMKCPQEKTCSAQEKYFMG
jgi:hypothetical protein